MTRIGINRMTISCDLADDGGLLNIQCFCRAAKAAPLGCSDDIAKMAQFDRQDPSSLNRVRRTSLRDLAYLPPEWLDSSAAPAASKWSPTVWPRNKTTIKRLNRIPPAIA